MSFYCYSGSGTGSEPWSGDIGLCFPIPSVYCTTLVTSKVPMGSRAYSFNVFGLDVNIDYVFVLVLPILCSLNIDDIIDASHSYVQAYTVAALRITTWF